jgi:hypothetical protein
MNEVARITVKMEILLRNMYACGEEEGREAQRTEDEKMEADAYEVGVDEGYNAAKREFHVPDL